MELLFMTLEFSIDSLEFFKVLLLVEEEGSRGWARTGVSREFGLLLGFWRGYLGNPTWVEFRCCVEFEFAVLEGI